MRFVHGHTLNGWPKQSGREEDGGQLDDRCEVRNFARGLTLALTTGSCCRRVVGLNLDLGSMAEGLKTMTDTCDMSQRTHNCAHRPINESNLS